MQLKEWIDKYGKGAVTELHHRSRLAINTIVTSARHGARTRRVAEALSEATGGEVSVAVLLGLEMPDPPTSALGGALATEYDR